MKCIFSEDDTELTPLGKRKLRNIFLLCNPPPLMTLSPPQYFISGDGPALVSDFVSEKIIFELKITIFLSNCIKSKQVFKTEILSYQALLLFQICMYGRAVCITNILQNFWIDWSEWIGHSILHSPAWFSKKKNAKFKKGALLASFEI